jgi:putative RNA 2'-phosphotransferase
VVVSVSVTQLSRTISHALRHEPWLYELELDDEGWVNVSALIAALREQDAEWAHVDRSDIEQMIATSEKRRHEIVGDRIRALYGHSVPGKLHPTRARPPELLFHGTAPGTVELILQQGLKPMGRQYVHLSTDERTAIEVGLRKSPKPALLRIRALEAHDANVVFYAGNDKVWLADVVPPEYMDA